MYTYSTSDRFSKIRNSKYEFMINIAYIPGPGGIEYEKNKGYLSPRDNNKILFSFNNTSEIPLKKLNITLGSKKLCENCIKTS